MFWLGGCALLAVLAVGYFRLEGFASFGPTASSPDAKRSMALPAEPVAAARRPEYTFQDILPEKEFVVPDAELADRAASDSDANDSVPVASPKYVLQAGAFLGSRDAEAMKARLALFGEVARVEIAQIDGKTVHRVRIGPFPNTTALAASKSSLATHGIAAQAIRIK